jgi:hypothetical protein
MCINLIEIYIYAINLISLHTNNSYKLNKLLLLSNHIRYLNLKLLSKLSYLYLFAYELHHLDMTGCNDNLIQIARSIKHRYKHYMCMCHEQANHLKYCDISYSNTNTNKILSLIVNNNNNTHPDTGRSAGSCSSLFLLNNIKGCISCTSEYVNTLSNDAYMTLCCPNLQSTDIYIHGISPHHDGNDGLDDSSNATAVKIPSYTEWQGQSSKSSSSDNASSKARKPRRLTS